MTAKRFRSRPCTNLQIRSSSRLLSDGYTNRDLGSELHDDRDRVSVKAIDRISETGNIGLPPFDFQMFMAVTFLYMRV